MRFTRRLDKLRLSQITDSKAVFARKAQALQEKALAVREISNISWVLSRVEALTRPTTR